MLWRSPPVRSPLGVRCASRSPSCVGGGCSGTLAGCVVLNAGFPARSAFTGAVALPLRGALCSAWGSC
eukprot:7745036-Alexandrium_andersonii.AAC.1